MTQHVTLDQIRTDSNFDFTKRYGKQHKEVSNTSGSNSCDYYDPENFLSITNVLENPLSYFHINCQGLSSHWDNFNILSNQLRNEHFNFDFIGISELFQIIDKSTLKLPGYHPIENKNRDTNNGKRGGVGLYVKQSINYKIREDLTIFIPHVIESVVIETIEKNKKSKIVGVFYRPNTAPRADLQTFMTNFDNIMSIINHENKSAVIMGDMNINLLKYENHSKTHEFIENLYSHRFIPQITKPTRVTPTSATLIDHIYTNNLNNQQISGIIITDVADHFATFHIENNPKQKKENISSTNSFRSINSVSIQNFKQNLLTSNFNDTLNTDCPNEAYNKLLETIQIPFNMAFPLKTKTIKKKYIKHQPWMTAGLLQSTIQKSKLLKLKLNKPTEENLNNYKKYNREYNKLKRLVKSTYYTEKIEEHKHDMKKTWTILKEAINKHQNNSSLPNMFNLNNELTTDTNQIAHAFNEFFSNIGQKVSQDVPKTNKTFTEYLRKHPNNIFLNPVTKYDIIKITNTLKPKTSSGYDELSTKLLKHIINEIIDPITHIINQSLLTGIVPDKMKIAKLVPIYKSKDPTELTNYRPISLLPVISKILEKVMFNNVVNFMNKQNLFYKNQYGFRQNHTTLHPIIQYLNHIADVNNKVKPELSLAVFLDLSKAFDTISHSILLEKLNNYGIRGTANDWFRSYLSNRKQYVEIHGTKSSYKSLTCGVPQGSILGPLLYLIYVNDIPQSCNSNILSFADDTTLYMSDTNINSLYKQANSELNDLYKWFCANKLSLNASKTKYIIIRPPQRNIDNNNLTLAINGQKISRISHDESENEKSFKFLGIHIDETLSWKYHINYINKKISNAVFHINKVKHNLPKSSLKTLYYALIHPHIMYGITLWGSACNASLKKTITLQKRALRIINKTPYNSHTEPLFKINNILKVNDLYEQQICIFMHKWENNKLPISFQDSYKLNCQVKTVSTRQSNLFHVEQAKNQFIKNLPKYKFPTIWNKIKPNINSLHKSIQSQIKKHFISKYLCNIMCTNSNCHQCHK